MREKKNATVDLTTGSPIRKLVAFALPLMIGAVFQLMYNMVDTVVLGKFVSAEALAAVGATASTTGLVMMIANAFSNGMSILISQAWGAKDEKSIRGMMGLSLLVSAAVSVVISVLAITLARPLMRLLGTPEDIIADSITYVRIACGLYAAQMFYNASSAILRAIGDSRTPLYFLIFCSLMNIVLDLMFVLALKAAVAGVAWATVLSQLTSAVLCCGYMWRKYPVLRFGLADLKVKRALLSRYFTVTLPMVFQNAVLSVGQMAITSCINSFGSSIVAAYTVGCKVEQVVITVFGQLAFSFSIYAGQNYGAKQYDRITRGVHEGLLLLAALVGFSMAVMLLGGYQLSLLFVNAEETEIIAAAMKMIRTEACFLPALCLIWVYNSALRGIGHVVPTVISAMVELGCKIGFAFGLSALFGYVGIWFAAPLGWVMGLIPIVPYFYFSGWKKKAETEEAKHG